MNKVIASTALALLIFSAANAHAFEKLGDDCAKCHTLTKSDAEMLVTTVIPGAKVLNINQAPMKGLWQIDIERAPGRKNIIYIDYSRKYFIGGTLFSIRDRKNLTQERLTEITRVDSTAIPVDDAILLGDATAKTKIIVFSDPDCPYCAKLHANMKEVVEKRKDIAFLVKMYPLPMHTGADKKAKAIICGKSLKLLEEAYARQQLPDAKCETTAVQDNIQLASKLGIDGTPALIFPDGRLISGAIDPQAIISAVDQSK